MSAAKTAARTFDKLTRFHQGTRPVAYCDWETYKSEMVQRYGCDPQILEAMTRLGHFEIRPGRVCFIP